MDFEHASFRANPSGGAPPYSFLWDFGDGGSSTVEDPTHTYAQPGTYVVTLTVTDSQGQNIAKTIQVVVREPAGPVISGMIVLQVVVAVGIVAAGGYLIKRRLRPRLR